MLLETSASTALVSVLWVPDPAPSSPNNIIWVDRVNATPTALAVRELAASALTSIEPVEAFSVAVSTLADTD